MCLNMYELLLYPDYCRLVQVPNMERFHFSSREVTLSEFEKDIVLETRAIAKLIGGIIILLH